MVVLNKVLTMAMELATENLAVLVEVAVTVLIQQVEQEAKEVLVALLVPQQADAVVEAEQQDVELRGLMQERLKQMNLASQD